MKASCRNCANKRKCNGLDFLRDTACKDYKKKENKNNEWIRGSILG